MLMTSDISCRLRLGARKYPLKVMSGWPSVDTTILYVADFDCTRGLTRSLNAALAGAGDNTQSESKTAAASEAVRVIGWNMIRLPFFQRRSANEESARRWDLSNSSRTRD